MQYFLSQFWTWLFGPQLLKSYGLSVSKSYGLSSVSKSYGLSSFDYISHTDLVFSVQLKSYGLCAIVFEVTADLAKFILKSIWTWLF